MIKLLIVDDSAFMRKLLSDLFAAEPDFVVVDTARNGQDAVDKVKRLKPDLVTMDIEMPVMDGIKALERIMAENPVPVVMVSSLTREGANATIKALELGAVDFIAKTAGPISNIAGIQAELIAKCRAAAKANFGQFGQTRPVIRPPERKPLSMAVPHGDDKIVAIGTSTGGPRALQEILCKLPGNLPCGLVIVQHMPPGFTKSLSERLNSLCSLTVREAEQGDTVQPGVALIAPGDYHMTLVRENAKTIIKLDQQPPIGGHRPAVDPLFEAVANIYGRHALGVILTGMGHDGAKGIQQIKMRNGVTIAEDQSTAVVFGMPKSAIELNAVDKIIPLPQIADEIVRIIMKL
ncbi:MAG: chemotaxis response regulator protein-glutamate methylesterase [Negativicutes bacterium]|nr:chemotaxis response regulator protein-glutamate methylesterase [Negativicutes bacterium]